MAVSVDFLLDANGDLMVRDGDFVTGESDAQSLALMLVSAPGNFRADPLLGVNAFRYVNSVNSAKNRDSFNSELRQALDYDNWKVDNLNTNDLNNPVISAEHPNN